MHLLRVLTAVATAVGLSSLVASSSRAEVIGLFNDFSTTPSGEVIGVIDPVTGAITLRGEVFDAGPRPSGVSDVDPAAGVLYFNANESPSGPSSLWSIDVATGAVLDVAAFTGTGLDTSPYCLVWDAANTRLLGIVSRASDFQEVLVAIDPATAAMTPIGAEAFDNGGFSSGVCDYDADAEIVLFVANLPGGSERALFRIDATTGTVIDSPLITTETVGLEVTPGFFAWDPVQQLGLAIVGGNLERRLGEIDPATGELTPVGETIVSSGFSSGVSDFDPDAGVLYYVANEETNTDAALFQVSRDGDLLASPVITAEDPDIGTSPSVLAVVPAPEPGAGTAALAAAGALALRARRRRGGAR